MQELQLLIFYSSKVGSAQTYISKLLKKTSAMSNLQCVPSYIKKCVYQINIPIDSSLEQTCYSVNYLYGEDSLNNK